MPDAFSPVTTSDVGFTQCRVSCVWCVVVVRCVVLCACVCVSGLVLVQVLLNALPFFMFPLSLVLQLLRVWLFCDRYFFVLFERANEWTRIQ